MKRAYPFFMAGLLLASLAVLLKERGRITALQQEIERLRAEQAALQHAKRIDQNGTQNEELEQLRNEAREVHKLRNEVSQLRAGAKDLDQLRIENRQLRAAGQQLRTAAQTGAIAGSAAGPQEGFYARENWAFAGYATPEAALQSTVWAMREGDTKTFLASLTPEEIARMEKEWGNKSEARISADFKDGTDKISNIRILESRTLSDDEVVLSVYVTGGEDKVQKLSMKRFGGEWKLAGPKKE